IKADALQKSDLPVTANYRAIAKHTHANHICASISSEPGDKFCDAREKHAGKSRGHCEDLLKRKTAIARGQYLSFSKVVVNLSGIGAVNSIRFPVIG
ncbi:MAG: hypothetical protein IJ381_07000, partial [Clostridia bacterium]|nr:hypothetical protein [Clostridia bacterium]